MTEKVVRYDPPIRRGMFHSKRGDWVRYSDYEALFIEKIAVAAQLDESEKECNRLAARVEELEGKWDDPDKILEVWEFGTLSRCKDENQRLREALEGSPCTCDKTDVCWVKECLRCAALKETGK